MPSYQKWYPSFILFCKVKIGKISCIDSAVQTWYDIFMPEPCNQQSMQVALSKNVYVMPTSTLPYPILDDLQSEWPCEPFINNHSLSIRIMQMAAQGPTPTLVLGNGLGTCLVSMCRQGSCRHASFYIKGNVYLSLFSLFG